LWHLMFWTCLAKTCYLMLRFWEVSIVSNKSSLMNDKNTLLGFNLMAVNCAYVNISPTTTIVHWVGFTSWPLHPTILPSWEWS
jgi:hypothetical protein